MSFPLLVPLFSAMGSAVAGMSTASLAMTGLTLASTAAQGIAQNQAAKAAEKNAYNEYGASEAQRAVQQKQINDKSTQDKSWILQQADIERGTIANYAVDAGFSGGTLDRLMTSVSSKANESLTNTESNRQGLQAQSYATGQASRASAQTKVASARASKSSPLSLGLKLGGVVAGAMANVPARPPAIRDYARSE